MDADTFEAQKFRYGYEAWKGRNTLDENLFIWRFLFRGGEFHGLQPHRIETIEPAAIEPPASRLHTRLAAREPAPTPEIPRVTESVWKAEEGDTETALRVDVFECASREAAHEHVLRLLMEFQSPAISRQEELEIGDITFADPEQRVVLAARANLVYLVRNAGRNLLHVAEAARQFDQELISKPEEARVQVIPQTRLAQAPAADESARMNVPLPVEGAESVEQPLMYKFFAPKGEIIAAEGQPTYSAAPTEQTDVEVYAISPSIPA